MDVFVVKGIPAADLKEHERHKHSGSKEDSDDEEEPTAKKAKPEGLLGSAPGLVHGIPGMVPGMMPPPGIHGMPPGMMSHMMPMGHMGPPFMHHPG